MAKSLKPFQEADLTEFLDTSSDFGFEQEIFRTLIGIGFKAQHGGTYADPITGLPREFDIRGMKSITGTREPRCIFGWLSSAKT